MFSKATWNRMNLSNTAFVNSVRAEDKQGPWHGIRESPVCSLNLIGGI